MEENTMELNLEFLPFSVKKGDVVGSGIYDGNQYNAVWVGGGDNNFKLVGKDGEEEENRDKFPNCKNQRGLITEPLFAHVLIAVMKFHFRRNYETRNISHKRM